MRVVASEAATSFIQAHGGQLFVWPQRSHCCGGHWLRADPTPAKRKDFSRCDEAEEFELYLPAALSRMPDELHLQLRGFPRRVEAYWDGCAWIL